MVDFEFEFQYAEAKQTALQKAAGSIPAGRCVVLCGGSGCGKTTLGKLIAGLYKPAAGQIALFGSGRTPKQLQSQVMFIMQEAEFQFFTNSVINELKYGHAATPEFDQAAETLLRRMGMWECRDRHPFSLSGGQMQKLTLMTAFLSEKPVIVLDEPTAGQDAESLDSCAALIREMGREKTVVIITHDLELIAKACTRCIGLADGGADAQLPVQNERELQAVRRYMEGFRPAGAPPVQKSARERFHPATKLLFWLVTMIAVSTSDNRFAFSVYAALLLLTAADGWIGTALAGGGLFAALWEKLCALPAYLEILTVPMALRVIRIAETLSASAKTRGIDLKRRKSNFLSLRFSALDAVFAAVLLAAMAAGLLL